MRSGGSALSESRASGELAAARRAVRNSAGVAGGGGGISKCERKDPSPWGGCVKGSTPLPADLLSAQGSVLSASAVQRRSPDFVRDCLSRSAWPHGRTHLCSAAKSPVIIHAEEASLKKFCRQGKR